MRVTAERATVGFCAAPEGAQDSYEGSVPSTPPPQFAQKTREPGPAACWAKLSRPAARDGTIVAEAAWRALAFQTAASSSLKSGTGALSPTQRAERVRAGCWSLALCILLQYSLPVPWGVERYQPTGDLRAATSAIGDRRFGSLTTRQAFFASAGAGADAFDLAARITGITGDRGKGCS